MATLTVPGNSSGNGGIANLLETNLNVSPYFDDFDASKQYYRVLFKPGTAVQVRELNQLQTILQNQIASFGQNVFKEGSVIKGCSFTFDNNYKYAKLGDTYANSTALTVSDLNGLVATNSRGLKATILTTASGLVSANPNLNTIYLKYNNSTLYANGATQSQFDPGENLTFTTEAGIYQGNILVSTVANAVGTGYAFTTTEGIIFKKGYFIYVTPQTTVISKYTNVPDDISVGFEAAESVISANYDSTLFDNAAGSPNYTAPGADRLKLEPFLVTKVTSESTNSTFFSLVDFKMGKPVTIRNDTQFNSVTAEEALRTYETNGDFVVRPFDVSSQTIANTSDPQYATHYNAIVSRGLGYVEGYRVEFVNNNTARARRGTDKSSVSSQKVSMSMGNFVYVNEVFGNFLNENSIIQVELHSVAKTSVSALAVTRVSSTIIGYAYIRGFNHYSGKQGSNDAKYRLYLFNVTMSPGKNFADVKSIIYGVPNVYTAGSIYAAADIVLSYNASVGSYFAALQNQSSKTLFFPFGQKSITSDGFSNISFNYRLPLTTTFNSPTNGISSASVTIPSSGGQVTYNDTFNFSSTNPNDIIVIPSADGTVSKTGSVKVYNSFDLTVSPNTAGVNVAYNAVKVYQPGTSSSITNVNARFRVNDPVYYSVPTGNVAIGGLTGNTWYYVSFANDSHIALSTSQGIGSIGGANIDLVETREDATTHTWLHKFTNYGASKPAPSPVYGYVYGTSANFYSNYSVGDFININNGTKRQIRQIIDDNTMAVSSPFNSDALGGGSGVTHAKIFPANIPIAFDTGNRSISIDGTAKTLTFNLGEKAASTFAVTVDTSVNRSNATSIKKVINKTIYVKINCATHPNLNNGPWSLGVPDVLKVSAVYVNQKGTSYSESGTNYVKNFVLDNGQRDSFYDLASIKLNNGPAGGSFSLEKTATILVKFSAFTLQAGEGVGFFTCNSYPIDDTNYNATTTISTLDIPRYTTQDGISYDLRDVVDFRPRIATTAALSACSTSGSTSTNPVYTFSLADKPYLPQPESLFTTNLSHYLGRTDRIALDTNGNIVIREGQPGINNPPPPQEQAKTMTLALLKVPPFPSLTMNEARDLNTFVNIIESKSQQQIRFTMADIGKINNRIKNLEYYTSLSLLEQSAASLQVRNNDTGQNRFQNGIFVDGFNGYSLSNTKDSNFYASIDERRTELRPAFIIMRSEFAVDLTHSSSTIAKSGDLIMLNHTSDNLYINQPFASKYYNCIEGNVYHYNGNMVLYPGGSGAPDITTNPAITADVDLYSNFANLSKAWGTQWSGWETVGETKVTDTLITGSKAVDETVEAGGTSSATGKTAADGGTDTITTTQKLQATQSVMKLIGTQLSVTEGKTTTQNLGTYLTSASLNPFVPAATIWFSCGGLKPNTRMYAYFDNTPVTAWCSPFPGGGSALFSSVNTDREQIKTINVGKLGDPLITDDNGNLFGLFSIPGRTFHSGELTFKLLDVSDLEIGESAISTQAESIYYGRTLLTSQNQAILSTRPAIVNSTQVKSDNIVTNGFALDTQIQKTFVANPPPAAGGGGGCGCGCFTSATLVMLASGKSIPISEVKIGDLVYNKDRTSVNTVKFIEVVNDKYFEKLYSPSSDFEPFATVNHPLYMDGELSSVDPEKNLSWYPWLGKNKQIQINSIVNASDQNVYNLWVDGDGTYTVNGYGTSSIIGDGGFLRLAVEQGILTDKQAVDLIYHYVTSGKSTIYGIYLFNKILGKIDNSFLNKLIVNHVVANVILTKNKEGKITFTSPFNSIFNLLGKAVLLAK